MDIGERRFTLAMHALGLLGEAAALEEAVDLTGRRDLIDVGCGSGVYSIHLCRRYPELRATLLDRPAVLEVAEEIVAASGVAERIALRPGDMLSDSYGEGRDVVLLSDVLYLASGKCLDAMALAGRPELLIADEPTTALDVTIQAQVLDLLKQLQRETGMAILLITHDLGVVAEMADRVGVMYAGQLMEINAVDRFFERPAHPYSQKLFRSVPKAEKRHLGLDVIPGIVPRLNQVFGHCRFADRCEMARDECRSALPPWRGKSDGGYRCHLTADEIDAKGLSSTAIADSALASSEALLQVKALKVHFPIYKGVLRRVAAHVKAVDGVDLSIGTGRTVALVGESGCGKTTVGKAILQLNRPTSGQVLFDGRDLATIKGAALRRLRREFQIIFQDPASSMNPRMLVEDIVAEGLVAQRMGGTRVQRRAVVEALLQQVGMQSSAADRYPHEFSGGQRQRIAIARALAFEPRLDRL